MEKEAITKLKHQFDQLRVNETIELPLSLLKPMILDDYTKSYTQGLIDVYLSEYDELVINDGNHRYYDIVRKKMIENNYKKPNLDLETIVVRKVPPKIY